MTAKARVVVLGAGPAGLGAAYRLSREWRADVTVIERNGRLGGNAASFDLAGVRVDHGSHRLHSACDPRVLADIRGLLDGDLLDRPRQGRIRLRGRWIHFPLEPLDLVRRLPPSFALGIGIDLATRVARQRIGGAERPAEEESFASVLEAGLGRTICRDFYFPYARKIWGLPPEELSAIQARRRVSAGSVGMLAGKVASMLPGLKSAGRGRYYYPRHGYGQIAEAYGEATRAAGARIHLNTGVEAVETGPRRQVVTVAHDGERRAIEADYVWSTIPLTALARLLRPSPPPDYLDAAARLASRAMILIYLVLDRERFSPFDAYYFPEPDIPITRLSEPKNFSDGYGAPGVTVLCAELPCSPEDPVWSQSDGELSRIVCDALARVGQPVTAKITQVAARRIRHAYPIYRRGYEVHFDRLAGWVDDLDGLLTFGRQGLFAHDNLHHALFMAYSAADCLGRDGRFDRAQWQAYRRIFSTHVVED
ncbi:MAG TPA: FAD-dependent oxidoreductase [Dehalococcoidia bacterium]|nr:FAD-dependent oxidoreductase [Dehalococcoidia bacterium]